MKRELFLRRRCPILVGGLLGCLWAAAAPAQAPSGQGVYLPTSSELEVLVARLEKAREARDWDTLLEGLAKFVEMAASSEPNTVLPSGAGLAVGLRRSFRALAGALPPEESDRYQTRIDSILESIVERGGSATDLRHRVLRDYPSARVAPRLLERAADAASVVGDWQELGRAANALLSLAQARTLDRDVEARARLLLGVAAMAQGDGKEARLQAKALNALGASAAELPADLRQAIASFAQRSESLPEVAAPAAVTRLRSSLEPRSAVLEPGHPAYRLGALAWDRPARSSRLRQLITERARAGSPDGTFVPYHAVERGDEIAYQHVDRVALVDWRAGTERWSLPLDEEEGTYGLTRVPLLSGDACYFVVGDELHAVAASSGESLWSRRLGCDMGSKSLRVRDPAAALPGEAAELAAPAEPAAREPDEAAEDDTQPPDEASRDEDAGEKKSDKGTPPGKAREKDKGDATNKQPRRPVTILSPPVAAGSAVLVQAHVRVDQEMLHFLVALGAAGEVRWTTFLGSAQGGNHLALGGAPSPPLFVGARAYALTNTGILASIDAVDGCLEWISEYPRLSPRAKRQSIRRESRWQPNPLILVGEQLIIAPQDSPFVLAVTVARGDVIWRVPRGGHSSLVGADEEACYVAGADIAAIIHSGPRRGQTSWTSHLAGAGKSPDAEPLQLLGRPFFTGGEILAPTKDALVVYRARDGRELSRTLWDFTAGPGNLLLASAAGLTPAAGASRDLLLVCAPEGLHAYDDYEHAVAAVERLPADGADSALQVAKLHLKHLDIERGLAALEAWRKSAPPTPQPNSALDHLHLDLAETVWTLVSRGQAREHAQALLRFRVALERTPERKVKAAIELAESLERAGDLGGALRALHDGLAFDNPETVYSPAGHLRVSSAAYIREQIRRLRSAAPAGAFAAVDATARDALRRAQTKTRTLGSYQEVVRLYPSTPAAREAYLDLSRLFVDAQNYEEAARALESYLAERPEDGEAVRVQLLLAGLLRESGRRGEARVLYEQVLSRYPRTPVEGIPGARPGETVEQLVGPLLRDPSLVDDRDGEPPALRFPVRMAWRSPSDLLTSRRSFFWPTGDPPNAIRDCFLTQSIDRLEMRSAETGLAVWTAHLELIPGFQQDDTFAPGFRYWTRTGRRAFTGRYVAGPDGPLLLAHDERNVLALDAATGIVRWHYPIGAARGSAASSRPLQTLRERLRGAAIAESGVYAVSTAGVLRHLRLDGTIGWERTLEYAPAPQAPAVHAGRIWVHSQNPPGLRVHQAETGAPIHDDAAEALKEWPERLVRPLVLPAGRLLLAFEKSLRLLDLESGEMRWTIPQQRATLREVFYDADQPDECIVLTNRTGNNLPGLEGISLAAGRESWRYEKFPTISASFGLERDRNHIFVIHGHEQWSLLALNVREEVGGQGATVEALWPNEAPLGHLIGTTEGRLLIGGDAVFFTDPDGGISVYDRSQGALLSAPVEPIRGYLLEKEDVTCAMVNGRIVVLTDGGDCAFESASEIAAAPRAPEPGEPQQLVPVPIKTPADVLLFDACRRGLSDLRTVSRLALTYFRHGDLQTALELLGRALLADDLGKEGQPAAGDAAAPPESTLRNRILGFLLDGIKEENMRHGVPRLVSRRVKSPPLIDGDLSDAWDLATALHLESPLNITGIPGPDSGRDWEGEEDLSAVLYTGWDDTYFYFAVDVKDDYLHPYDKDAENWKGDCLIIGVDPLGDGGFRQNADDQLMTLALTIPKRKKIARDKDENAPEGDAGDEEDEEDARRKPAGLFSVKKKDDNSGAIYEVALPWSSMVLATRRPGSPQAGYSFGLSLLLTDDDSGQGATKTLSANPCHLLPRNQKHSQMWRFIIPYYFPRVTLE